MFIDQFVTTIIILNTASSKSYVAFSLALSADCITSGQRLSENEHFCF
jgi:hypothetical protein